MAQLSSVIGSVLRDIISAQHEANLYSISLGESYGKDGKAKDFQLPNVVLSDIELELRYGVTSAEENKEEHNIKYSKFRRFVRELCGNAAKITITSVVSTIMTSDIQNKENDKKFFYRLKQEDELNRSFLQFLARQMRIAFNHNLHETIDAQDGTAIPDIITSRMMEVVDKKFLDDGNLGALFTGPDGQLLKTTAEKNVRTALLDLVTTSASQTSFKRTKNFPQINVAVTADELAKLPEDTVQTLTLKITPTTCSLTQADDDDESEVFIFK